MVKVGVHLIMSVTRVLCLLMPWPIITMLAARHALPIIARPLMHGSLLYLRS